MGPGVDRACVDRGYQFPCDGTSSQPKTPVRASSRAPKLSTTNQTPRSGSRASIHSRVRATLIACAGEITYCE